MSVSVKGTPRSVVMPVSTVESDMTGPYIIGTYGDTAGSLMAGVNIAGATAGFVLVEESGAMLVAADRTALRAGSTARGANPELTALGPGTSSTGCDKGGVVETGIVG